MATDLLLLDDDATAEVEFVGFESTLPVDAAVPLECAEEAPKLPVPVKARSRRTKKPPRRTNPVRVIFDDDEFLKLNLYAGVQGMALSEFVRRCALRDPRARTRPAVPGPGDLFARDKVTVREGAVARMTAPLSADLEHRIDAYFSAQDGFSDRLRLPARPSVVTRFGHFVAELVGSRWGNRATPPAGA
jgi:hypothetical protein